MILFLFSLSIIFPAIVGSIKLMYNKNILPLVICFYLGTITTLIFYFVKDPLLKNVFANIYVLIEYILILLQLSKWGIFKNNLYLNSLLSLGLVCWLLSTINLNELGIRNAKFRLFYSFIITICSIDLINKIAFEKMTLLKDYRFLITLGFIIFYLYNILVEGLCMSHLNFTDRLIINIFNIKGYLNFTINLLYTFALLCIPKNKTFTI